MEIYKMTFKKNMKYLRFTIIVFCLPIAIFFYDLSDTYNKTGELMWLDSASNSIIFFLIISLITIPGFLLHFKYYNQDKGKSIKFHSKHFEIIQYNKTIKVDYIDILKIERHFMSWKARNPWGDYGYINILLKDNSRYNYSCLIYDINSSKFLFKSKRIIVEDCDEIYPW